MSLDPVLLTLSLIPGGVGYVLFRYGKRAERVPQLVVGLALMVYPCFADTAVGLLGGGLVLVTGLYAMLHVGW